MAGGIVLPDGRKASDVIMQARTGKERRAAREMVNYWGGSVTRAELAETLKATVKQMVNEGLNNFLHYLLENFNLTPTTPEGEKAKTMLEEWTKAQEELMKAKVETVKAEQVAEEAKAEEAGGPDELS